MAQHKSNVDFLRGNLHDGRSKRSAHHFGSDFESRGSFLTVLHIQAQVQIGWDHSAQQSRAAAYADVRDGGHVSGNFQLRRHGGEFQRDLKADFSVGFGGVSGPQEK